MEVFKNNIGGDLNGGLDVYDRETIIFTYCSVISYKLYAGTDTIDQCIKNSFLIPLSFNEVI